MRLNWEPMLTKDRLIVALDVPSATQARHRPNHRRTRANLKVGKQLFTAEGPQVVRDLVSSGRKVFLDLKFHDIPNTVAGRGALGERSSASPCSPYTPPAAAKC